jgi:hypothetical protein
MKGLWVTRKELWIIWLSGSVAGFAVGWLCCLLGIGQANAATQCAEKPGGGARWMWREIEGRRCWYTGDKLLPKAELAWPAIARPPAPPAPELPDNFPEKERADQIIMLRVRVVDLLRMPLNQLADGLVDLMRAEPLEGASGLGAEWRIPIYRYSESLKQ